MAKAATLLELIERLVKEGYPEGTAKKIATGELPMDFVSRMNRARDQGFRTEAYHTGDPNVLEFNPDAGFGDRHGGGTWFSQEPEISASYTGPESAGYRVLLDDRDFATFDAGGSNWNDLYYDTEMVLPGGKYNTLEELETILGENVIDTTDKVARAARDMGASGVEIAQVRDLGGNYPVMKKVIEDMNPNIERQDWINDYDLSGGTNYSVQDPSKIRSYYGAAFDPDNKGLPNILGGAAPIAAGGILAALSGNDAQASEYRPTDKSVADLAQRTIRQSYDPLPSVGSIEGVPNNPVSQGANTAAFKMDRLNRNLQNAGILSLLAPESTPDVLGRAAYGESRWYDPALVLLDFL